MRLEKISELFGEQYSRIFEGLEKREWIDTLCTHENKSPLICEFFQKLMENPESILHKPSWQALARQAHSRILTLDISPSLKKSIEKSVQLFDKMIKNCHSGNDKEESSKSEVIPDLLSLNVKEHALTISSLEHKVTHSEFDFIYSQGMTKKDLLRYCQDDTCAEYFISKLKEESKDFEDDITAEESFFLENLVKRRNTYPYDFNRTGREVNGFYINASDINASCQKYIFAAAPPTAHIKDFWHGIANLRKSPTLICLAMPGENGKTKWHACWDENLFPLKLDDGTVVGLELEEVASKSTINPECSIVKRIFSITSNESSSSRALCQLHYQNWPDAQGAPDMALLEELFKLVDMYHPSKDSYITIMCSAAKGRTGTFGVLDIIRRNLKAAAQEAKLDDTFKIDLRSLILELRRQRRHMVSTKEQIKTIMQMTLRIMNTIKPMM